MPAVIALIVILAIYLFLVFPGQSTEEARKPFVHRNFAHRGLYDNEKGVPENSLAAFRAAMEAGYGCELDVQFTKDKKLIVFHDNDYKRACGVDRPVWELTFDEARELRLFGTDERVPTFREVLDAVDGRNPLIVEIKAEGLNMEWYTQVCEAVKAELADYSGEWCLESFHPLVVRWAWKNMPSVTRGLLVGGPAKRGEDMSFLLNCIALLLADFTCRPQFIAYNHHFRNRSLKLVKKLGAFSVMWTVGNEKDHEVLENEEDVLIFEHYLPDTRFRS
ncbi:MAG: glycerophosphodiester phosphodiesterase family protein [Bacillota bacterium]